MHLCDERAQLLAAVLLSGGITPKELEESLHIYNATSHMFALLNINWIDYDLPSNKITITEQGLGAMRGRYL